MAHLKSGTTFGLDSVNSGTAGIFIGYGNKNNEAPLDVSTISDSEWVLRWTTDAHTDDNLIYNSTIRFTNLKTDEWEDPLPSGVHNTLIGSDNHCDGSLCTLVGLNNRISTGYNISTAFGMNNSIHGSNCLGIGTNNYLVGDNVVGIGDGHQVVAYRGISLGASNVVKVDEEGIAIGSRLYLDQSDDSTTKGILLGYGAEQDTGDDTTYVPDKLTNFTGFVNYSENITESIKSCVKISGAGFIANRSSYISGSKGYAEWFDYNAGDADYASDEITDLYNELVYLKGSTINKLVDTGVPIKKIGVVPNLPQMFNSVSQPDGSDGDVTIIMNIGNSNNETTLPSLLSDVDFDSIDFISGNYTVVNKVPVIIKGKVDMKSPTDVSASDKGSYLQYLLYEEFNDSNCDIVTNIETSTDPWKYGHFKIIDVPDETNNIITIVL